MKKTRNREKRTALPVVTTSALLAMSAVIALAGCASAPTLPSTMPAPPSAATGEASAPGFWGGIADSALALVGMKKPEAPALPNVPDSALPDYKLTWQIYASDSLNTNEQGQALALVVRLYRLRSPDAFLQAPYDTFGDPAKEKAVLADDLISARELQLVPGQHHEARDKVPREARYVGIVALYRSPLAGRWRYAFNSASADKTGLRIGAHACAMSVQVGEPIGVTSDSARVTAAPCP